MVVTTFDLDGKWRSHSIMASVIYNFWAPASASATAATSATSAAAASGDADVSGWLGDPGDGHLSGPTATASAASAGARARISGRNGKEVPARARRPGRFSFARLNENDSAARPASASSIASN